VEGHSEQQSNFQGHRAGSGAGTGVLLAALPAAKTRETFKEKDISE
jgi:hypothetical protein